MIYLLILLFIFNIVLLVVINKNSLYLFESNDSIRRTLIIFGSPVLLWVSNNLSEFKLTVKVLW